MANNIDFWRLLAGLSFFLYGMFHLEDAVKQLEGRSFKLFLKKYTKNKFSAILNGTMVTALLQSSSIVNLTVLSFVGAGILSMRNALGVVLGANIGGTFNSWLVALLGFKVDLSAATFPIIAIAGLGIVLFKSTRKYYQSFRFLLGFGLLFMGLDFMKSSMDQALLNFDFKPFLNYPWIFFLASGFVITALIQTSAATVVIVLSALNASIIPLDLAVLVVLGAELGTNVKVVIGSIGGIPAKKRVALANSMFNAVSTLLGCIFLNIFITFIKTILGINDPVLVLVAFQTLVNLLSAIIFYFFLNRLGDFLEHSFTRNKQFYTLYLNNASVELPDTAAEILEKEVGLFIQRVMLINEEIFLIEELKGKDYYQNKTLELFQHPLSLIEKYELIKKAEGEMLLFYTKLLDANPDKISISRINQLLGAVRNALYAAKSLKDVLHDVHEFSASGNDLKYSRFKSAQSQIMGFNQLVMEIIETPKSSATLPKIKDLLSKVEAEYKRETVNTYQIMSKGPLSELDISTLFNLNREIFDASKALVLSVKDYLLDETESSLFNSEISD